MNDKGSSDPIVREDAPSWSSYAFPKWHIYQGATNDCGPYCVAIVGNTFRDLTVVDPVLLAKSMASWRRLFIPARVPQWATFPWGIVWAFEELGFEARWRVFSSRKRLYRNLRSVIATIVLIGEPFRFKDHQWQGWSHYKVLYGWDPVRGWAFVDPGVAYSPGISWQKDADFFKRWRSLGCQIIEIWKIS